MRKKQGIHTYHTKEKGYNKNKIIILIMLVILVILSSSIFFIKFNKKESKTIKIGKNSTSQEIVDYVLNINSYETEIDVEIKSNKNSNRYKMKQTYISKEENSQEVLEPSNIEGVKIIKQGNNLKIENTKLSLTKIVENYKDVTQNNLDLSAFIDNYKYNSASKFIEEENQIIMETVAQNENNYQKYETLYVSKENGLPTKMEIKDTNQNIIIYIIYNKIKV